MILLGLFLRGLIIWALPFVLSIPFYSSPGELVTSYALFKSVMVLLLTWTTILVNSVRPPQAAPALAAAVYLGVNLVLDALIVVPLANLSLATYLEQIGLVYLIIPTLTYVLLRRSGGQRRLEGHVQA
jgi:hypothetical protein